VICCSVVALARGADAVFFPSDWGPGRHKTRSKGILSIIQRSGWLVCAARAAAKENGCPFHQISSAVAARGKQHPMRKSTASNGPLVAALDLFMMTPSSFHGTAPQLPLVSLSAGRGNFLLWDGTNAAMRNRPGHTICPPISSLPGIVLTLLPAE